MNKPALIFFSFSSFKKDIVITIIVSLHEGIDFKFTLILVLSSKNVENRRDVVENILSAPCISLIPCIHLMVDLSFMTRSGLFISNVLTNTQQMAHIVAL